MWQLGQNEKFPDFASWQFPSWANSVVYPGGIDDPEIELLRLTTTPEWFMQEIGADFASFVGKIFPEWNETVHVKSHTFRPEWPNYIAFDFGYTNPLAAVEFQVSPDDKVYIWREHYKSFTTIPDHIDILKNREHPPGYHLDLAFGDPADPEAAATISTKFVPCISDPKVKSDYTWRDGVDLLRNFMKLRPTGVEIDEFGTPGPDEPGLTIDPSCTNAINEINNYRSKEPVKGQNVPEFGTKMQDHCIDALRYAMVYIYKMGATSHLTDVYSSSASWRPPTSSVSGVTLDTLSSNSLAGSEQGGFGSLEGVEF
jgi:hypothetical protein